MKYLRNFYTLTAFAFAAVILSACGLFGGNAANLQAQIATQCTIVNGDLAVIGASPLLTASQQDTVLNKVLPANQAVCKGVATLSLNTDDLKTLHDSLLPSVVAIVQSIPAFPNQTLILLGLNTFGPMVQQLIDELITAKAAAATAASAPVAASQ